MKAPALFIFVAACVALTACAPAAGPDPVTRYQWDGGAAMQALHEGVLVLDGGCLYVDIFNDPVTQRTIVAFPSDLVSWDAATETLTYFGRDFAMGDEIKVGGGGVRPWDGLDMPEACTIPDHGDGLYVFTAMDFEPLS